LKKCLSVSKTLRKTDFLCSSLTCTETLGCYNRFPRDKFTQIKQICELLPLPLNVDFGMDVASFERKTSVVHKYGSVQS